MQRSRDKFRIERSIFPDFHLWDVGFTDDLLKNANLVYLRVSFLKKLDLNFDFRNHDVRKCFVLVIFGTRKLISATKL